MDTARADAPSGELVPPGPSEPEQNGEAPPAFTVGYAGVRQWVIGIEPPEEVA